LSEAAVRHSARRGIRLPSLITTKAPPHPKRVPKSQRRQVARKLLCLPISQFLPMTISADRHAFDTIADI